MAGVAAATVAAATAGVAVGATTSAPATGKSTTQEISAALWFLASVAEKARRSAFLIILVPCARSCRLFFPFYGSRRLNTCHHLLHEGQCWSAPAAQGGMMLLRQAGATKRSRDCLCATHSKQFHPSLPSGRAFAVGRVAVRRRNRRRRMFRSRSHPRSCGHSVPVVLRLFME